MRWLKQFAIIMWILFFAEILTTGLSIPLPGTVLGMGILLVLLLFQVIPLDLVEEVGNFLLGILILLFIPAGVGIIEYLDQVLPALIPIFATIILSTIMTMVVTGHVVQYFIRRGRKRWDNGDIKGE